MEDFQKIKNGTTICKSNHDAICLKLVCQLLFNKTEGVHKGALFM